MPTAVETFAVIAFVVNMGSVIDTALLFQASRMPPRVPIVDKYV